MLVRECSDGSHLWNVREKLLKYDARARRANAAFKKAAARYGQAAYAERLRLQAKADAVYAGVAEPLVAADIAEAVRWIATLPEHVNIDRLVIRPRAQAANWKVARD